MHTPWRVTQFLISNGYADSPDIKSGIVAEQERKLYFTPFWRIRERMRIRRNIKWLKKEFIN